MEGKVCTKCGVWKPLEEYYKNKKGKYGRRSDCKECEKKCKKQHYQNNKEHKKEYYQNNKEHYKEYRENNKEHKKEYDKEYRKNNKQNNLQNISGIVEQINPTFKQLNLPVCGYIYMFKNVKTGRYYIGQTINPLSRRYNRSDIVKGWIEDRLKYNGQKFKEELIEEDIIVTEVLDIAFCQYHLDKLEAYYIGKYDSFLNGYNNREGNHNTDDGIEEFNQILKENNLQFINGQLLRMEA